MRILLTNDDGIYAPGLTALRRVMMELGEVWVVAPAVEQSGVSHGFSLIGPLRCEMITLDGSKRCYAVQGTPVDTVKLALHEILPELPDLVVSGINSGENSGVNLLYSGTLAAAMEGAILGIPSIAVSLASFTSTDYSFAAEFTLKLSSMILKNKPPHGTLLNVNIPAVSREKIRGIRITHQASSHYEEEINKRVDPRGRDYFWISGRNALDGDGGGSDMEAVRDGYISITPVKVTQTDNEFISSLKEWTFD